MPETLAVEIRALAQVVEDEVASMRTRRSVAGDLRTIADRVEQEQAGDAEVVEAMATAAAEITRLRGLLDEVYRFVGQNVPVTSYPGLDALMVRIEDTTEGQADA